MARLTADPGLADESRLAESLRENIEAESGPMTLLLCAKRDLDALLEHPRLGSLVRRLSPNAGGIAR